MLDPDRVPVAPVAPHGRVPKDGLAALAVLPDAGLDVQVKRGFTDNELTRYRYDVTIHKTPAPVRSLAAAPIWTWADCVGLTGLHTRLTSERQVYASSCVTGCEGAASAAFTAPEIFSAYQASQRRLNVATTGIASVIRSFSIWLSGAE